VCDEEVPTVERHPVLRAVHEIDQSLKDITDVPVEFLSTTEKREALLAAQKAATQLESLRMRLMAASSDVADDEGVRDIATWLSLRAHTDRAGTARLLRLAQALDTRWLQVGEALRDGRVTVDQAEVIVRALNALPKDLGPELVERAEARLVTDAEDFGPRELRVLGRRILDVIAPEIGEDAERKALEAEEEHARRTTSLTTQRYGDGSTLIRIKVPDAGADRLVTYLDAFASPRQPGFDHEASHDQRLGQAFCSLLEHLDPAQLPQHGGDATTVLVTIDLATLRDGLGTATLGADTQITAGEARRLACTAKIIPVVLGANSEVLDLGRARRLYNGPQRKALNLRHRHCRAEGCTIPATWCEAHHAGQPWAHGGKTDLADAQLLCAWHHHRAHDDRYSVKTLPNGDVRFHKRT
jgi:hypothetical protein